MQLTGRNFSFQTIDLTEDTEFVDCNLTLAHVNQNGHAAVFVSCNITGLYLDGVKQDEFVWQRFEDVYDEDGNFVESVLVEERS